LNKRDGGSFSGRWRKKDSKALVCVVKKVFVKDACSTAERDFE
jgi:hypothetical protein